ncbi:MAG: phospho-N-acetylmuramoyl-pentapeptide-transferase [Candidatus Omnitrophota bacterium]
MLYYLLYPLRDIFFGFNVLRYITFRAAMAAVTTFILSLVIGPYIIRKLKEFKIGEHIRQEECPSLYDLHEKKKGTPTMGGIFIALSIIVSTLLWADIKNKFIILVLFSSAWLAVLGFRDDYIKLTKERSKGLTIKGKLFGQLLLGLIIGTILLMDPNTSTRLDIPFLKTVSFDLGIFYILFVILVIVGSSNAVNLTDGLDGLAVGCVIMAALVYSVLSYVTGNIKISEYLFLPYIQGTGELTVFCASILGACLGFLWFNCYPANIFMGDVGSLSLGGAIGTVAVLIKKEILLVFVGGVFVLEALSVLLQIFSFRIYKKRIFKMAPLHHHFQMLGWPESKVIVRFWIIASILAILTLVTLKLR